MRRLGFVLVATLVLTVAGWLAVDSVSVLFKLVFAYAWLVLLPGLVWVWPLREDWLATFILSNLAGFAFGVVYFLLDMAGVALSKVTFLVVPLVIIAAGLVRIWTMRNVGSGSEGAEDVARGSKV